MVEQGNGAALNLNALRDLVVRDQERKIEKQDQQIESQNQQIAQLEAERAALVSDLSEKARSNARLANEQQASAENVLALESKLVALRQENERLSGEVGARKLQATNATNASNELTAANTRLQTAQKKLADENEKLRAENGRLGAKLGGFKGSEDKLKEQDELIARLQSEQASTIADCHALSEENDVLRTKLNEMADSMEQVASNVRSLQNHSDKTGKLMSAQFAELQRVRRSWAYVVMVNGLLQRDTLYSVPAVCDVFLLSSSSEFLGEPYRQTPYCVYMLLEISGKGHVVFEHNGKLVSQSNSRLPLTAAQKSELVEKIKTVSKEQLKAELNEGLDLCAMKSNGALASAPSIKDMTELGEHFLNVPEDEQLMTHFQEIMKWYQAYKREYAAREKQKKKVQGKVKR